MFLRNEYHWMKVVTVCWALGLAFAVCEQAHSAPNDDWTTYQHDVNRTGRSSVSINPRALRPAWSAPEGYQQPLVVGDKVIAMRNAVGGNDPTRLTAFRLSDGQPIWSTSQKLGNSGFPSYAEGLVVYAGFEPGQSGTSLYVHDANTGALKYTVPIDKVGIVNEVTLHRDTSTGQLMAYATAGNIKTAVQLGASSGSVVWAKGSSTGIFSLGTIGGQSLLAAGDQQYWALDLKTGEGNKFRNAPAQWRGSTVAFDVNNNQFYALEELSNGTIALNAFLYTNNQTITPLWQRTGAGIRNEGGVAIGADGKVYSLSSTTLVELDPVTGAILRQLDGQNFDANLTPMLSDGYLWASSTTQTFAYDLTTFSLVSTFDSARGSSNTPWCSPGAITSNYVLLNDGWLPSHSGFDVYVVPEANSLAAFALGMGGLVATHARRQTRKR